jgi:hypothetical protein
MVIMIRLVLSLHTDVTDKRYNWIYGILDNYYLS